MYIDIIYYLYELLINDNNSNTTVTGDFIIIILLFNLSVITIIDY